MQQFPVHSVLPVATPSQGALEAYTGAFPENVSNLRAMANVFGIKKGKHLCYCLLHGYPLGVPKRDPLCLGIYIYFYDTTGDSVKHPVQKYVVVS